MTSFGDSYMKLQPFNWYKSPLQPPLMSAVKKPRAQADNLSFWVLGRQFGNYIESYIESYNRYTTCTCTCTCTRMYAFT